MARRHAVTARQRSEPLPVPGTVITLKFGGRQTRTRIESASGQHLSVVAPTHYDGSPVDPPTDQTFTLEWATEHGRMFAEVAAVSQERDVVVLWNLHARKVVRQQRRDAYRLRVRIPTSIHVEHHTWKVHTADVSETGFCGLFDLDAFAIGTHGFATLTLPAGNGLASGPVRSVWSKNRKSGLLQVGFAFAECDVERSETLRTWVLYEQMERRAGRTHSYDHLRHAATLLPHTAQAS